MNNIAVLTGDIIKSSSINSEILIKSFEAISKDLETLNYQTDSYIDFFRGDSWQLTLRNPSNAFRVAIQIRSLLRSKFDFDTRISIAIGEYSNIHPSHISLSSGEVYTDSGKGLDEMKGGQNLKFTAHNTRPELEKWIEMSMLLCDVIINDWTKKQAELTYIAITSQEKITGKEIATKLNLSPQSINTTLQRANWKLIEQLIQLFETEFKDM